MTGNSGLMRSINRSLIIESIMQQGFISRSEIESSLGLALPTVIRIVDDLLAEGLVMEIGKGDSSGGRKPVLLQINPNAMYFIGVSIQRKLKVVLANAVGTVLDRYEVVGKYDNMAEDILKQILDGIAYIIRHSGVDEAKIASIGIGTPGTLFKHGNRIEDCPFKNWAEFDTNIWKYSGRFKAPVEFENVAKLGALGELRFGYGKSEKNFIYVFADYGIGAGIVADGKLFTGTQGVAGEFGHTIVHEGGEKCYCGNNGCLEMYSATPAIVGKMKSLAAKEEAHIAADEAMDFPTIMSLLESGNSTAAAVIKKAGKMLGIGLGNLINLINPSMVVIGGELAESCPLYLDTAKHYARHGIFSRKAEEIPINVSQLGNDSELLGAVALAMNKAYQKTSV